MTRGSRRRAWRAARAIGGGGRRRLGDGACSCRLVEDGRVAARRSARSRRCSAARPTTPPRSFEILADAATDHGDAQLEEEVRAPPPNSLQALRAHARHPARARLTLALHPSLHRYESSHSSIQQTAASGAARAAAAAARPTAVAVTPAGLPPDAAAAAAAAFARRVRLPGMPDARIARQRRRRIAGRNVPGTYARDAPPPARSLPAACARFLGRRPWPRPVCARRHDYRTMRGSHQPRGRRANFRPRHPTARPATRQSRDSATRSPTPLTRPRATYQAMQADSPPADQQSPNERQVLQALARALDVADADATADSVSRRNSPATSPATAAAAALPPAAALRGRV